MILDIIIIGIFILFVILGVFKGAARMLIGLGISFVSFLLSSWLGKLIASGIYSAFISPAVNSKVAEGVQNLADGASSGINDILPWWLKGSLDISGQEMSDIISGNSAQIADKAGDAVNAVVQPIITGIMAILLTLILFFIVRFLLRLLLMKPLLSLFKAPIINGVNKALGGVLGGLEGVLVICMLAYILKLVMPYIGPNVGFLNESTIYNSFIFYHFYSGNIFTALTSWIR